MIQQRFNKGVRLYQTMAWANGFKASPEGQRPPVEVWAEYFGVRWPQDFGDLMRHGADLVAMAAEVKREVRELAGQENVEMLLRRFPEVEAVLQRWPDITGIGTMATFMQPLSDAGLYGLEMISDRLSVYSTEHTIDDTTLDALRNQIRATIDLVTDADDLDPQLQRWLLQRLWDLHQQVDLYKMTGVDGIGRSLDEVAGGLARRRGWLHRLGESKTASGVLALIATVDFLLQSAVAVKELTDASEPSPVVQIIIDAVDPLRTVPLPASEADIVDAEVIDGG